MATRDATMQTYLVLKGRPIAQTWVKARELSALGRADSHSVGKPYPPDTVCVCVHVCVCVCVTGEPQPLLTPQRLYKECKTTPNYFSPTPT